MKTIKINEYNELEKLKLEDNSFILDVSDAKLNIKKRIIDFISGLTLKKGSLKKIKADTYEVIINNK